MTEVRLISSIVSSPPPPPPPSSLPPRPPKPIRAQPVRRERGNVSVTVRVPRRLASLTLLPFAAFLPLALSDWCPPAAAFSLGISGPKEWLRNQKKNAARFVLAPIDASRRSLQAAYLLLSADTGSRIENPGDVRKLFNSAARDCVPEDRSSIVAFQARTGVEVCTFRLIVSNAASLLDKYDPLKLEAKEKLDNLIRQKVKDGLNDTIFALGKFEESVKGCLEPALARPRCQLDSSGFRGTSSIQCSEQMCIGPFASDFFPDVCSRMTCARMLSLSKFMSPEEMVKENREQR